MMRQTARIRQHRPPNEGALTATRRRDACGLNTTRTMFCECCWPSSQPYGPRQARAQPESETDSSSSEYDLDTDP